MRLNTQLLAYALLFPTLTHGLPLDSRQPQDVVPRAKSYAVINVDGGTSTDAPAPATTVVKATKTIEIVNPGPTVTEEVTSTLIQTVPAQTSSSSSSQRTSSSTRSTSSPLSTSTPPPEPVFVTVTVPESAKSTEYYDNGLWHTLYPVKTFEDAAVQYAPTTTASSLETSSTVVSIVQTTSLSYNATHA